MPQGTRALFALGLAVLGAAAPAGTGARAETGPSICLRALDELGVSYETTQREGIEVAVEVGGDLGGVTYKSYNGDDLVLDCSLVYSLARAGELLRARGIERAVYSSAYQRRTIRGTNTPSSHSFGLAIDVHEFEGDSIGRIRLKDDYEQGLGGDGDCLGRPLTRAGAILRDIDCRLGASGLFRFILSPDYDAHHYNHFHLEAEPLSERRDIAP